MTRMLRILSAVILLAIVAGCGGSAPEKTASPGLPRALAQDWEGQAAAIAAAAAAGQDCHARQLAASLQSEVEQSQHKLPLRLRTPLVTGVTALAARTTCTPVVVPPAHKKEPPPKGHEKGGDKGHDHGHDKGHGHHGKGGDG